MTVEAARFERIGRLLEIVRAIGPNIEKLTGLLAGIDLSKLGELFAGIAAFAGISSDPKSEAGIIERVTSGLALLKLWASMTATTVDDSLSSMIDKVLGNPDTLKWIAGLVASLLAKAPATPAAMAAILDEETATVPVSASAFDFGQLIAMVKLIFELIAAFRKPTA